MAIRWKASTLIALASMNLFCGNSERLRADDTPASSNQIQQILRTIQAQDEKLHSLKVTYTYSSRVTSDPIAAATYTRVAAVGSEKDVFAMKGRKRFFSFDRTGNLADRTTEQPSLKQLAGIQGATSVKTAANSVLAFDGSVLRRRDPGGEMSSFFSQAEISPHEQFDFTYLRLTGRVPRKMFEGDDVKQETRLSDAISVGVCQLRNEPEVVDGSSCVVLDWQNKPRTTLWCDPLLGYAIRRKEQHFPTSDIASSRTTCDRFREVLPGFWLPLHATLHWFADLNAPANLCDVPLVQFDLDVETIDVNDVPDELFELKPPPGTLIADYRNGPASPNGRGPLPTRRIVDAQGEVVDQPLPATPLQQAAPLRDARHPTTMFIVSVVVLLLIVTGLVSLRRNK